MSVEKIIKTVFPTRGAALLTVFLLAATPAWGNVGFPEQTAAALEYQLLLARTPSERAEERELLYLALVEECPDTPAAQEALWALANLYLDGFEDPQEAKAQEVLEYFMLKYPDSPWAAHVGYRLAWLYDGTEHQGRAVNLYEAVLRYDMPLAVRLPMQLRCAEACEGTGQTGKALEWYERIVKESASGSYPETAAAKARLAALRKDGKRGKR